MAKASLPLGSFVPKLRAPMPFCSRLLICRQVRSQHSAFWPLWVPKGSAGWEGLKLVDVVYGQQQLATRPQSSIYMPCSCAHADGKVLPPTVEKALLLR